MENEKGTFEDLCEKSLRKDNPQIIVRLYANENDKKNKEHNNIMKGVLSLCQDEPLKVENITEQYVELSIGKKYIQKILLAIKQME